MPVWLQIIAANAVICLACYARGLYLELKSTKEELKKAKETIAYLNEELREKHKHN